MSRYSFKIGDSRVLESRESSDGVTIRRRRETSDGKHRFTTYERIERPNLAIIKKDGSRELFDREKLLHAVSNSVGKFFAEPDEIDMIVAKVEDDLYDMGDTEIDSREVGERVLAQLANRNQVAYVRFASVFHEFKTLDDFMKILKKYKD